MECIKLFGVFIPKPPSPPSISTLPSNLPHYDPQPLSFVPANNEIRLENPVEQPSSSSSSPPPEPVVLVKPKRIIRRPRLRPPHHPQELPQSYCNFLVNNEGLYGNSLRLIFTRRLNVTDMSERHKRLSMPCKQTMEGFLTSGEEDLIRKSVKEGNRLLKKKIDVVVVDPSLKIRRMKLARWNYGVNDKNKKKSWWYALTKDWNKLADDNGLAVGDVIQVWSFRTKGGDLGFIIHKIG